MWQRGVAATEKEMRAAKLNTQLWQAERVKMLQEGGPDGLTYREWRSLLCETKHGNSTEPAAQNTDFDNKKWFSFYKTADTSNKKTSQILRTYGQPKHQTFTKAPGDGKPARMVPSSTHGKFPPPCMVSTPLNSDEHPHHPMSII